MTTTDGEIDRRSLVHTLLGEVAARSSGRLLRTREVALLFEVSERAVTDWATRGRIASIRTPGGHRRYPVDDVVRLLLASGITS